MLNQIQKPISRTVHSLNGIPILNDQRNIKPVSDLKERFKNLFEYQAAYLMDYYYAKQLNRLPFHKRNPKSLPPPPTELKNPLKIGTGALIGVGPFIALTETIAATFLVVSLRTISTWINLATTLGEFVQTWAAGTDSLGDPNDLDKKKANEAKDRRESWMAGIQVFAGGMGGLGFVWDQVFGEEQEIKEVPLWKKLGLSLSSAFNAVFMFFSAAEKTLISGLSKNGEVEGLMGHEYNDMKINGHNDRRCTAEWIMMTALPWLSNINLVKNAVDLLIIYGALREGFDHYLDKNKINGICDDLNKVPRFKKFAQYFCDPTRLFFAKTKKAEQEGIVCYPFNKALGWFLGSESDKHGPGSSGFRQKYLVPVLRFFGSNPPICYLDKSKNVVSEFYSASDNDNEVSSMTEVPSVPSSFLPQRKRLFATQ